PRPALPQQTLPFRQLHGSALRAVSVRLPAPAQAPVGLLKFTFGTVLASGGAWKNGYSLKPNTFAVRFAGNCRRDVLYSWTRSLYRMRSVARRFSVPASSSISRLNCSLA